MPENSPIGRLMGDFAWHWATARSRIIFGRHLAGLGRGSKFDRSARVKGGGIVVGDSVVVDERVSLHGSSDGSAAISIGDGVHLWPNVLLDSAGGNIAVGSNVSIGSYTEVYGHGGCEIGDDCQIAGHCYIIPANHNFDNPDLPIREQGMVCKGIKIEPDCWLGHGVSILDGVTIGRGSVIAARAVVTKDVPELSVVVGIPGRVIGRRGGAEG